MIARLLLSLLLTSAAVAADWHEVPLHQDVAAPSTNGFTTAVASDGRNFLVGSNRYGSSPDGADLTYSPVTLVDANGTVLRDEGLPLDSKRITWAAPNYHVFGERKYATVDEHGVVLRMRSYPAGVEARGLSFDVSNGVPGASNGRRSLVILSRNSSPYMFVGMLFDGDGEVVGEIPAPIEAAARGVRVASDGNVFAITWYIRVTANGGIFSDTRYLAIYDNDGKAIAARIQISADVVGDADLTSDGHSFGVFPTGSQAPHPASIFRPDGTLARRLPLTATAGSDLEVRDTFAIGTSGYYLNGHGRDGSEGWFLPWPSYEPERAGIGAGLVVGYAVAATAGRTMIVDNDEALIIASKADLLDNPFKNRIRIFTLKPQQNGGAAAANTSGTVLVVWHEGAYGAPGTIYAVRVTAGGVVLDREPIDVGPGCYGARPAVSSDGRDFLVSWLSCATILSAHVSAAGTLLDPVPLTLAATGAATMRPSATFDGTNYVVAWQTAAGISVSRISPGGSLLDLPGRTFEGTWPLVAPAPDGVLLVYVQRFGGPQTGHIVTQRLDHNLIPSAGVATVSANWNNIQPAWLEPAADRYLLTYSVPSDEASRSIHAAQWLTGNGERIIHGGSTLFPTVSPADYFLTTVFPGIRANCTGRDCTLSWAVLGQILAAPMGDQSAGQQIVAAAGSGLRTILFTGTAAAPRMLIYARKEGQSYRIFVRSTAVPRRHAVGR
jgi:hypothetical protein